MKIRNTIIAGLTSVALIFTTVSVASASPNAEDAKNWKSQGQCEEKSLRADQQEFASILEGELARFDRVSNVENVELTARERYPNDLAMQKEYISFASAPLTTIYEDRAIPAIVAAAIPVIAACVARGLSGAALDQVVNALRGNDLARVDDLIWSFGAGCVGWGPLKWAYNTAKPVAARALTWAVKQALKLTGKI
ncbi:hypothetical protein ACTOVJ_05655 [Arcanobacterium canis]